MKRKAIETKELFGGLRTVIYNNGCSKFGWIPPKNKKEPKKDKWYKLYEWIKELKYMYETEYNDFNASLVCESVLDEMDRMKGE